MSRPTPHRTPLRRISQGSLFALSRSQSYPDAPHGLGFLEPAMAELADETESLQANLDGLKNLSDSLKSFNESFASWLYVMNMNALTTDWPQAPTDASFQLAQRRAEADARAALAAIQSPPTFSADTDKTTMTETTEQEMTYAANTTTATALSGASGKSGMKMVKKKGAKPKLTAKEKKERNILVEKTISCLPLEFRGSDPVSHFLYLHIFSSHRSQNLRRNMETVVEAMMDSEGRGVKLLDLIAPPDLNQARVNKCLIALVNRKILCRELFCINGKGHHDHILVCAGFS
ncbi:hypothetical protein PILCRDRAFT_334292 [Piloderma croceum F 1598]|uniref:DASH complex subunit DAM1 n=1 Tax=Piloderma croceum (strain F 1598) TaxID=765440 RepID=A0A0C3C8Y0_PILCF|nr:hypothetical protein PILCRDRAFT_334292 [Piloderma croceum F 1598]